jgi:hypothetical protein
LNDFQITDRKLTLDDDFEDPELAKALELTIKTGRHDLAEILLKVDLNTINQINQIK